jgi:hypothetical protein
MKETSKQAKSEFFESALPMYLIVLVGAGVLYIVTAFYIGWLKRMWEAEE